MNSSQGQTPHPTGNDWDDDEEPWRHPPVAPKDAGIADSLGKAVSDVVTGPLEGDPAKAVKPAPRRPSKDATTPGRKP
jgi:hypothetical protein